MAFRPAKPATQSADEPPVIPALQDDQRYAAGSRVLRTLTAAKERLEREQDILDLERHFRALPISQHTTPRNRILRDRLNLQQRRAAEAAPADASEQDASDVPPAVRLALELLRDGAAKKPKDSAARLREIGDHLAIVEDGLREQARIVEEIRQELSHGLAERLRGTHDEILVYMFRHARELAAAVDRERAFRAAILAAGYDMKPHIISPPPVRALLMLGSEAQHDSAISGWRRLMVGKGLLND